MARSDEAVARLLLDAAVIDARQLAAARAQIASWGGRLHHVVVEMGFAREDQVAAAIAAGTRIPRVKLAAVPPDAAALARLDAAVCEERNVFPCALKDNGATLWLAVSDPTDEGLAEVVRATGVPRVLPVVAGFDEIQEAILRTYRGENRRRWAIGEAGPRAPAAATPTPTPTPTPVPTPVPAPVVAVPAVPMPPGGWPVPPAATPSGGWPVAPAGGWPVPRPEPSANFGAVAGAATISKNLDDLLGLAGSGALSPEELQRLAVLKANQDRMSRVVRAIIELCAERGVFTLDALKSRLR